MSAEVVYDVDLTRNRPDCWGHLGVARDLAAHLGVELDAQPDVVLAAGAERAAPVEIVAGDRCGRFTATVLSGVAVGPSPDWLARRLTAAGMRPINNVVDVSNYVMLERNQPNHAYDLERLGGGGFRVRLAGDGETMTTLDEVERTLTAADLLICDADDTPIGIGGIMGGRDSEISDAHDRRSRWRSPGSRPTAIQHSAARLGLRSEASARFERGVDPYGIDASIARFVELLSMTCPDLVVHAGAVDARGDSLPPAERTARGAPGRVNALLGTTISAERMIELLDPIGYTATLTDDATLDVALPSWRPDSTAEVDVIEEIARHFGYAEHRQDRAEVHGARAALGPPGPPPPAAPGAARPGLQRGDAQPVPRSRRPRGRRSARRVGAHRQPAGRRGERAAHVAAPGSAQGGGAQRVAPPRRASRCTRSATSTRRGRARCPTSTRPSASCSPVPTPRRRWPCGGRSPRRWASAPGSTRARCPPACTRPARRRCRVGRDVVGARRRGAPRRVRRVRHRRARRRARAEPRRAAGRRAEAAGVEGRPAATRRATSTWRSPPRRR